MQNASRARRTSDDFLTLPVEDELSPNENTATVSVPRLLVRGSTNAPGFGTRADTFRPILFLRAFSSLGLERPLSRNEDIATVSGRPLARTEPTLTSRRPTAATCVAPSQPGSIERKLLLASLQGQQVRFEKLLFSDEANDANLTSISSPLIANTILWHAQHARIHFPDRPFAMELWVIERLISLGARVNQLDPAEQRESALWMALQQVNENVVKLLLEHGCDPNSSSALTEAVKLGMHNHVSVLLQYGANPNLLQGGKLPLNQACQQGDVEMAKRLLKSGARMNLPDATGKTAFTYACLLDKSPLITLLCQVGLALGDADLSSDEQSQRVAALLKLADQG